MKKGKLLLCFILVLLCAFTLASCKKRIIGTTEAPQPVVTTTEAPSPVTTTDEPAPITTTEPAPVITTTEPAPVITTTEEQLPEGTLELESIPEGKFSLSSTAGEKTATAYLEFAYKESVLELVAYVADEVVFTSGNIYTNDSIELALDKEVRQTGYTDKTVSIIVDAKGNQSVKALASGEAIADSNVVSEVKLFSLDHKTIAGYMVKISVPYTLVGIDSAQHNAAACIALTNANSQAEVKIEVRKAEGEEYENVNTFARVTEAGALESNKYSQLGIVWGNAETLLMSDSWDILHDDETSGAYIEMTSVSGDNNIYMHRSNALEEYVEVKLTAKQLLNNEKWGKFGISLRSKDGNRGFFYYVDAASGDNGATIGEDSIALGFNVYDGEGHWANNWSNVGSLGSTSAQYQNDNYVTLGVYRNGSVFALYANGNLVKYVSCDIGEKEEAYFGLISFNILLKAKEYKVQKDNLDAYRPETKNVDYLFIGDSYIDIAFWYNFDSAFGSLNATNIGVGGTKVEYWTNQLASVGALYNPQNIIVHIGVNDIDDGNTTGLEAYQRLVNMLNKYHAKFPSATIYFVNICHNMMFTAKWGEYDAFNQAVEEFVQGKDWVKIIDMASKITATNGSTMRWYNADGLHYGVDGYALFNKAVKEALGLTFALEGGVGDVSVEGAPELVHTPTWEVIEENGETVYHNVGVSYNRIGAEAQFFFKGLYSTAFYAEAKLSLEECYCSTDAWAKTGIAIRTATETYYFFIDSQTGANSDRIDGHIHYTNNWGNVLYRPEVVNRNWSEIGGYVYLNTPGYDHRFDHSYMTLGVARIGSRLAFWANGSLVKVIEASEIGADEMAAVSIFTFNMNAYAKDLTFTTTLSEVRAKMPQHNVIVPEETPALKVQTSKTTTFEGDEVELTITTKEGITVEEVRINDVVLEKTDGKYIFQMPYEDANVTVKISGSVLVVDSVLKNGITLSNEDPSEGDEVTVSVKEGWILKSLLLNGEALTKTDGVYKFTLNSYMELTGEVILPADQIEVDLELETELYGTPNHFLVADNRDVTVYAAKGSNGVYVYFIAHTNTNISSMGNWFDNHSLELRIQNLDRQIFVASSGQTSEGIVKQVSVTLLESGEFAGKYEHKYEFFVPKEQIVGWSLDSDLEFAYVFKAPGEQASHEAQSGFNWYDQFWQTTNGGCWTRQMQFGQGEAHPGNVFVTRTGLRSTFVAPTPQHGTIDGNLEEFESKAKFENTNAVAKFIFSGYTAADGLYLGFNIYSQTISHDRIDGWHLNDNIEMRLNGVPLGVTILDKFVNYSFANAVCVVRRIELTEGAMYDAGYRYQTIVEYFVAGAPGGEMQFGTAGVGFGGWTSHIWDANSIHIDSEGLRFARNISVPEATTICTPTINKSVSYVGETIELTLALADGVTVNQVKANDTVLELADGKYSFVMPDQNVNITITFNTLLDFSAISQFVEVSNENPSLNETITITPKGQYIISSLLDGETPLVVKGDGTVDLTITGKAVLTGEIILPADNIDIDLTLDSALYGDSVHFWVEDNRDVTVYAAKGVLGVYVYVIAHTNANVVDAANWYENHNFEFEFNGGSHFHIANNNDVAGISDFRRSSTLLESGDFSGKYEHLYEFFVSKDSITGWSLDQEVEFGYAYKAIGEEARFEGQSFNQWPVDNFWQTTTGALNTRFMKMYEGELHPGNLFVGTNGLVDRSRAAAVKHATIDANLSEYAGKSSITIGNANAKFVITGFTADDGLYLAVKAYQINIAAPTVDWWLNDNLQINYGCDYQNLGISIFDHFVVGTWETKSAMTRVALESGEMYDLGYRYETTIEIFCPGLGAGTLQFGCNGNGFNGWQAMIWDGNVAYIGQDGVHQDVYADRASILVAEGITVDGIFDEAVWTESTKSKVWSNTVQGSRVSLIGRRIEGSNTIILGVTVEHNRPINENVQGNGSEWWHYIGPEFRLNWNGDRQYASSPYLNTTISSGTTAVSACHTVTNDEGADYTYTTTFEFVIVYSGYKLDFCPVCIGGVWNDGFAWVWEFNWLLRVENDGIYLIS